MKRSELHIHTPFTYKDSVIDGGALIEWATDKDIEAVGVTDINSAGFFPELQIAIKSFRENGQNIKGIYGIEGYIETDASDDLRNEGKCTQEHAICHVTILVKNQKGLWQLYKAMTETSVNIGGEPPCYTKKLLNKYRNNLLIGSGCVDSEVFNAVLSGIEEEMLMTIGGFYDYLEIMPVQCLTYLISDESCSRIHTIEDLKDVNRKIVALGERLNIPVVAVSYASYIKRENQVLRDSILISKGVESSDVVNNNFLRTAQELLEDFSYLGETKSWQVVVKNTNDIIRLISEVHPLPEKREYPQIEGYSLRNECMQRVYTLYGNTLPEDVAERLDFEISAAERNRFEGIYKKLSVLFDEAISKKECRIKGVANTSLIAYVLGLSDINPMEYQLAPIFYLGREGNKIPYFEFEIISSKAREIMKEFIWKDKQMLIIPEGTEILKYTPLQKEKTGRLVTGLNVCDLERVLYSITISTSSRWEKLYKLSQMTGMAVSEVSLTDNNLIDFFGTLCDNFMYRSLFLSLMTNISDVKIDADQMITVLEPKTFNDYVKIYCASITPDMWQNNQKELAEQGKVDITGFLSNRDDVYDMLIKQGMDLNTAFCLSESVRKGKKLSIDDIIEMQKTGVTEQTIDILSRINFMNERAHGVAEMNLLWKLVYYYIHYPDEYKKM